MLVKYHRKGLVTATLAPQDLSYMVHSTPRLNSPSHWHEPFAPVAAPKRIQISLAVASRDTPGLNNGLGSLIPSESAWSCLFHHLYQQLENPVWVSPPGSQVNTKSRATAGVQHRAPSLSSAICQKYKL